MAGNRALRLRDPRCFGCVLWTERPPARHRLLVDLGPEPLGDQFTGHYLYNVTRGRRAPIKGLICSTSASVRR